MSQSNAVNSTSEASKLLAHINASSAKLAEAEMAYAETVLELDVLLEPFYADADIRRTIAECSDRARKLFRLVLKFRSEVNQDPIGLAQRVISESETLNASKAPKMDRKVQRDNCPVLTKETILQRNCNDLQSGSTAYRNSLES
tara:strand:- start:26 stop:457 length:432 start_codon:yes stop_codon:yes gene_type:complete